ncbi:MAG: hypothetical protein WC417_07300 [Candidatus Omnitrophota bacterium]|jgi:hypothetical protein
MWIKILSWYGIMVTWFKRIKILIKKISAAIDEALKDWQPPTGMSPS